MIKKSMIMMILIVGLFMAAEYRARGYFALGAEILLVPMWIVSTYEYWKEKEKKRQGLFSQRGE